ncbi:MAG: DegQ family serine endoprotease [Rhodospirillaceae bacterium]|nr:DegQ family serine endoprotease [Rhodospirillaceae bacterium]
MLNRWRETISAVVLAIVFAVPVADAQTMVPSSRVEMQMSFAPLVKAAAPAVVNIYTRKVVTVRQRVNPFMDDPFLRQFFGDQFGFGQSVPRERVERALGSGVIVGASGVIVTNNHVVDGADEITVVLADRREFPATLVGRDPKTDLAVLKIDPKSQKLPFLRFGDADSLEVGDLVLAIGNPFGLNQTVTSGIVSALARTSVGVADYGFFIQTDAAINPGNSGGALIDMKGRLVGINSAIYSRNGAGSIGIGFAIPSQMVEVVSRSILSHGHAIRSWFGANGETVTSEVADSLGLDHPFGAIIGEVFPGGPAARAGLKSGDIVLAVNAREVADVAALRYRLATIPVGGKATLSVLRQGQRETLTAVLIEPPETPSRDVTIISGRVPLSGGEIANLNPALAEESGLPLGKGGVVVLKVKRGSIAARLGFRSGDRIVSINRRAVDTVSAVVKAMKRTSNGWRVDIDRNGERLSVKVD